MKALLRKLPLLSDLYRLLRNRLGQIVKPQKSVTGFLFVGNQAHIDETYENQITDFLLENHQDFDHFINIGANTGYWPVLLRHHGFSKKITLIEPDRLNLAVLRRNIDINGFENIEIKEIAAGNFSGFIELYGFGTGVSAIKGWAGGSSKRMERVRIAPIDDIIQDKPGRPLVLIDVEGLEYEVLEGATKLLQSKSDFLIEIATFENQPKGIQINPNFYKTFYLMQQYGYAAFGWAPGYQKIDNQVMKLIANQKILPTIPMYHFKRIDK